MADFQPFDLGRVLQTAQVIKGMRRQDETDKLQQAYMGQRNQREQAQFDQGQAQQAREVLYRAVSQVEQSPDPIATTHAIAQDPQLSALFQKMGVDVASSMANVTDPNVVRQGAASLRAKLEPFITPQKPVEVAANSTLALPNATGTGFTAAFTAPPAPMSPYQQAEATRAQAALDETSRHNRVTEGKPPPGSVPSGYEQDPTNPGALRPAKGGPHDPDAVSGGMDSRSSVMFNRVAASAQAASKAIQNIMELPVSTSSGWFGTAEPGHGLMASARNVLAQKVTGQEAQDFKTMVAGVSRNLSTIETAGLAPNGAITNSMNAVLLGEGDTQMTKLRKMAEMRQIVEENLKPQLANPKLAPQQKQLVRDIITSVQGAVPFTHHDITLLQKSKNPQATIMDFATQQNLPGTAAPAAAAPVKISSDADYNALPSGAQYVAPDGSTRTKR